MPSKRCLKKPYLFTKKHSAAYCNDRFSKQQIFQNVPTTAEYIMFYLLTKLPREKRKESVSIQKTTYFTKLTTLANNKIVILNGLGQRFPNSGMHIPRDTWAAAKGYAEEIRIFF